MRMTPHLQFKLLQIPVGGDVNNIVTDLNHLSPMILSLSEDTKLCSTRKVQTVPEARSVARYKQVFMLWDLPRHLIFGKVPKVSIYNMKNSSYLLSVCYVQGTTLRDSRWSLCISII